MILAVQIVSNILAPWVQTQKHQIVNSGFEPTIRQIDLWVQTQVYQIVKSGSEPTSTKIAQLGSDPDTSNIQLLVWTHTFLGTV